MGGFFVGANVDKQVEEGQEAVQDQDVTDQEQEDALVAGYNRGKGIKPDVKEEPEQEVAAESEATPEQEAAEEVPEPEKTPEELEWEAVPKVVRDRLAALESLPNQMHKLSGHIGGLKSQLEATATAVKAVADRKGEDTPTNHEVQSAVSSPEAWKNFKDEWPEFADAVEARISATPKAEAKQQPAPDFDGFRASLESEMAEQIHVAEERAYLRFKHPGYVETVNSQAFVDWFKKQPKDVQALDDEPSAQNAIALLDKFEQHKVTEAERLKKQERLASAVPAKGVTEPARPAAISDEEALLRGYRRYAPKRLR